MPSSLLLSGLLATAFPTGLQAPHSLDSSIYIPPIGQTRSFIPSEASGHRRDYRPLDIFPSQQQFSGPVTKVYDGDTVTVLNNGVEEKIRLQGIDAPEMSQPYGEEARDYAAALVLGKRVRVLVLGRDRYKRILGIVKFGSNGDLNRAVIGAGFAWWYRYYSDDENLERLESNARSLRWGLWQDPNPEPPWEYRRRRRGTEEFPDPTEGQQPTQFLSLPN